MIRIFGAVILLLIFAVPVIIGPAWVFFAVAQIVILVCLYEFYRVSLGKGAKALGWIAWVGVIPVMWLCFYSDFTNICHTIAFVSLTVIAAGLYLFEKGKASAKDVVYTLVGIIYPAGLLCFWILIRNGIDGKFWMIFGLLCTFISDTGAYYAGKNFGKHNIAPRLSPKKTWEGLIGGIIISIIAASIFGGLYPKLCHLQGNYPLWILVILGGTITILGLIGDLTASMFKREFNVKDMGNLIPGHGGMLDRMDGIIPVGVVLYLIILVIS
ncbi:MAG: phosphatidate cytidylyltransferase [Deltaproteobacteria bacterium]|nr:phosphatidate cytidylyltransferase [Deltaproteobacteria bacterium]